MRIHRQLQPQDWSVRVARRALHLGSALQVPVTFASAGSGGDKRLDSLAAWSGFHVCPVLPTVMFPYGWLAALVALVVQTAAGGSRQAEVSDAPELDAGFHLLYELKPEEARAKFAAWRASHPEDPLGSAADAASYLFEECYRQGVLTSDFFSTTNASGEGSDQAGSGGARLLRCSMRDKTGTAPLEPTRGRNALVPGPSVGIKPTMPVDRQHQVESIR